MNIILVHGFMNRASIMRSLSKALADAGHVCHAPSLSPKDGRNGLGELSAQLAAFIQQKVPAGEGFVIVGFSMGALVARHYLQEGGGDGRVRAFFSVAGPHRGTYSAFLFPGRGAREMRWGSRFLRELNARSANMGGISAVSYWTPFDVTIRPISSAKLAFGEKVRIPAPFHTLMLFDRRLHRDIIGRLGALVPSAGPSQSERSSP
jgi:triacylglycerol lipase